MPPEIQRELVRLLCKGIMSNVSPDILPEGYFPYLQNIRIFREGIIQSRPSINITGMLNPIATTVIHSIRKLEDKSVGLTTYVIGAGTRLYSGALALPIEIESGFNGKRFKYVEYRPENSIDAYLYLTEGSKFRSVGVDNISNQVGIDPPKVPVTVEIDKPIRKIIDEIGAATFADWIHGGVAGATSNQNRVNTTIAGILLDGPLPNFCSIIPNTYQASIQEGCIVSLSGTESVFVEEVRKSTIGAGVCTIASIKYEAGVTGKCTIDLSTPINDISVGSILFINASEYVKVEEVIRGANGTMSVVVTSIGTFVVGNTIVGAASFRTYITLAHAVADTIQTDSLKSIMSGAGLGTLTKTANYDFTNASNRALTDNDFFHCSLLVSDASQIEEIQIQCDIDSSTNDFLHNWYNVVLNPDDLLESSELTENSLAIQQQALSRRELRERFSDSGYAHIPSRMYEDGYGGRSDFGDPIIEYPGEDVSTLIRRQLPIGDSQWAELLIPLKNFHRNGSDASRGWKDIKAIRISIKVKGVVDVYADSIWVGGGYDLSSLDSEQGVINPYRYIARYRESKTKRVSNWSPIPRHGLINKRTRNLLSIPISPDSRVDKIDFARIGGAITDFRIIGAKENDASKYTDSVSDSSIRDNSKAFRFTTANSIGESDFYKPFAILDKPKKGTCNVVGNKLTILTGDVLNTSYPPRTRIVVDNVLTRFYLSPTDANNVELLDNLGTLNNVDFEIKEPLLTGQALPIIIGPFGLGNSGLIILGAGDVNAAGTVYWLDGNSPDTQSDLNKLEITPSSEPIIGGVMYDGLPYFWTNRRAWQLIPTVSEDGILTFIAREVANSTGLASRDTICAGEDYIYYLRRDLTGIDRVQGNGNPQSITSDFISNLFTETGIVPDEYNITPNNTFAPPDFAKLDEQFITVAGKYLYYRYINTLNTVNLAVYEIDANRWISIDKYEYDIVGSVYEENTEGDYNILLGISGKIAYYVEGLSAIESLTECKVVLPTRKQNDIRLVKDYKEIIIDLESLDSIFADNNFILEQSYKEGNINFLVEQELSTNSGRQLFHVDINNGEGQISKDIGLALLWTLGKEIRFYNLDLSFVFKPLEIKKRKGELDYGGNFENKFIQGLKIKANTNGIDKILDVYDEFNIKQETLIINHINDLIKPYSFQLPFISHAIRIVPNDDTLLQEFEYQIIYDKEPESTKVWEGQENNLGTPNIKQAKKVHVTYRSTDIVTLKLALDNNAYDEYPLPNTNGKRVEYIVFLKSKKFKHIKCRLESVENFSLYRNGCKMFITDLTLQNDYVPINPFGDDSNVTDVRI